MMFGQMTQILSNLDREESRYEDLMSNVNDQIAQLDLLPETEERITDYYEFQWRMNSGMDRQRFLQSLSPCLRNEILLSVYADIVSDVSFFKGIQDAPDFICLIVERLTTAFYLPSDVIVHEGELTSSLSYMYFITLGKVAVYHPSQPNKIVHQMGNGNFFGEMGYLDVGSRRTSSVCALTNCDIALLQFKDIDALVATFPGFKMVREERGVAREGGCRGALAHTPVANNRFQPLIFTAPRGRDGGPHQGLPRGRCPRQQAGEEGPLDHEEGRPRLRREEPEQPEGEEAGGAEAEDDH